MEARKSIIRFADWRRRRQIWLDQLVRRGWVLWTELSRRNTTLATVRRMLPEVFDLDEAYAPVLIALDPDILHVHHPFLLPTAARVRDELRRRGRHVRLLYDARENFAGMPSEQQGNRRRHHVLVSLEARTIRQADVVTTVSPLIAEELQRRYGLSELPTIVFNMPVLRGEPNLPQPTVRDLAGVDVGTPLLIYSGGMNRARGLEELIDALAQVPEAVLALIPVPHPHPMIPGLLDRAVQPGVADRIGASAGGPGRAHPLPVWCRCRCASPG